MSMMCRPMWPFLLMYESHDMRHSFPQVDGGQRDSQDLGCHSILWRDMSSRGHSAKESSSFDEHSTKAS